LERQNHTISPSAQTPLVAQQLRPAMCVHRIPLPTSVTIASRPSYGCGMGESIVLICPTTQCRGRATDWRDGQCRILGQMRLLIVGAPRAFQSSLSKIGSEGFLHAGLDDPNQIEPAHEINFCAQAILVELMEVSCPTCRLICLVGQVRVNRNGRHRRSGMSGPKGASKGRLEL